VEVRIETLDFFGIDPGTAVVAADAITASAEHTFESGLGKIDDGQAASHDPYSVIPSEGNREPLLAAEGSEGSETEFFQRVEERFPSTAP
jgi:hypothetical protein